MLPISAVLRKPGIVKRKASAPAPADIGVRKTGTADVQAPRVRFAAPIIIRIVLPKPTARVRAENGAPATGAAGAKAATVQARNAPARITGIALRKPLVKALENTGAVVQAVA